MAITDELREFKSKIQIYRSPWSLLALRSAINCIADRIDAAYEADVYAAGLAGSIQYELEHCPACKNVADLQEALAENTKLRELVRDYHTFLALADLAQPIGHIIAASGHPTLSVESLDSRYRELGILKEA